MLEVEGLDAWYGAAQILFDVSLHVGRGEVVALMGRNGAGKSTTMKALMGLLPRRSGTVRFCGEDISRAAPVRDRAARPRLRARGPAHLHRPDRAENLDVGRQPPRRSDGRAAPCGREARLFALFPNLGAMPDRPGGRMSGGEQQMLTVARTLMGNPLLVLLDEPSEGVAPLIVEEMANTILALKQEGVSVLLSEQNLHFAALVADRVYGLEKGEVRWHGTMAAFAQDIDAQRALLGM